MPFLDSVLDEWNVAPGRSSFRRAGDKLVIEIETPKRVATIEAWERGPFLDLTVLELESGSTTILAAGECKSLEEMRDRIALLRRTLAS